MYLGAYESVKTRNWTNMNAEERNAFLAQTTNSGATVDIEVADWNALGYDGRNALKRVSKEIVIWGYPKASQKFYYMAGTTVDITTGTGSIWSGVVNTATDLIGKIGNTAVTNIVNPPAPAPAPKTEATGGGFVMPEIPNWVLPVGLLVIAGIIIVPQMMKKQGA